MNLCNMSKFDNLIEIAKESAEIKILEEVEFDKLVFLPTKTEDLIFQLGGDWYYQSMLSAGYSHYTASRKVDNMDFHKLEIALDDWYKTELYPKLYNKFKSDGREILDY